MENLQQKMLTLFTNENLLRLPTEMIIKIACQLPSVIDLVSFLSSCKSLLFLNNENRVWKSICIKMFPFLFIDDPDTGKVVFPCALDDYTPDDDIMDFQGFCRETWNLSCVNLWDRFNTDPNYMPKMGWKGVVRGIMNKKILCLTLKYYGGGNGGQSFSSHFLASKKFFKRDRLESSGWSYRAIPKDLMNQNPCICPYQENRLCVKDFKLGETVEIQWRMRGWIDYPYGWWRGFVIAFDEENGKDIVQVDFPHFEIDSQWRCVWVNVDGTQRENNIGGINCGSLGGIRKMT
jgi:hypothetical protein